MRPTRKNRQCQHGGLWTAFAPAPPRATRPHSPEHLETPAVSCPPSYRARVDDWKRKSGIESLESLLPQRRGHELDRVVARPFRRSRQRRKLAAVRIDQQRGRHAERLARSFQVLKHLGAV